MLHTLYVDMNSFFASVEQERDPALRGKPVAVVPLMADTTCCIAVSYEAKACGVKTGTRVAEAKKLCPGLILIQGQYREYTRYHHAIVDVVESCLPVEAVLSIDELACRLTGSQTAVSAAEALAMGVKREIREKVGSTLRCSIGLGPNRYLAKIASDMMKPDGLTVIRPCDLPDILLSLKLRDLPGIGAKMEAHLNERRIYTMKKLLSLNAPQLRQVWGSIQGEELWHLLRGHELGEVESEQKSISQSHVLPPEERNPTDALSTLKRLVAKAAARMRREKFYASGIEVVVRFRDRSSWKKHMGVVETQDTLAFLDALVSVWPDLPKGAIFGVGVVLTGLVPEKFHTPSLFQDTRREQVSSLMDQINERFGKDALHFGATHWRLGKPPSR